MSVVPMIQCRPHGITNSTDFSVLVMKPDVAADPVAGYDEVDALAGLDVERAPAAEHVLDLVGPHSAGVDDDLGPHLDLAVVLQVTTRAPTTRSPSRRKPITLVREATWAPYAAAVRAMFITSRASSTWQS